MNSKIKKAMEAILKSYFEGEVIFEESEIAEVIDAATNDGSFYGLCLQNSSQG